MGELTLNLVNYCIYFKLEELQRRYFLLFVIRVFFPIIHTDARISGSRMGLRTGRGWALTEVGRRLRRLSSSVRFRPFSVATSFPTLESHPSVFMNLTLQVLRGVLWEITTVHDNFIK